MKCTVCQRDTKPYHIDGQNYCSECGNLYTVAAAPAPARHNLDLAPRRAAVHPAAKPATALHHRSSHHVIDLRDKTAAPVKPASTPAAIQHHHQSSRAAAPAPTAPADTRFTARLTEAKRVTRSTAINRFSGGRLAATEPPVVNQPAATAPTPAVPELPPHAVAQHAALSRLTPLIPPEEPTATTVTQPRAASHKLARHHLALTAHHRRLATTAAAVALMGGYIWLQNAPKLALQTADARAGITASLPGFMPSSYTLADTATQPGLITLKFTSPSAVQALTIAQQRTGWDSNSLLDNYVQPATDDYAAITGQGLTIYLFGNNTATWVNHGLWYSIQGASQLSRDQILKIAYSL